MDLIAQKANQARSTRGGDFESKLTDLFLAMKTKGVIKKFEIKPIIFGGEFNPDFLVTRNDGEIISVDATTTARTDRLRAKQWDSYGTKLYFREMFGKEIKSYVVVQEPDTNRREIENFRNCKRRCRMHHSSLDDTISVEDLVKIVTE